MCIYKLLDFGVAKLLHLARGRSDLTTTRQPLGTPYFMAPEQIRVQSVDAGRIQILGERDLRQAQDKRWLSSNLG